MPHHGVSRREVIASTVAGGVALSAGCIQSGGNAAESFPEDGQEIDFIIPFGTGGGFDTYSRGMESYLETHLDADVEIVPENVDGGAGVTGTNQVYNAAPDGTTIMMFHGTNMPIRQVLGDVNFDVEEFIYPGMVAYNVKVIVSRDGGPSTWDEIASQAESDGSLAISTDGAGGSPQIAFEVIASQMDGVEAEFVHYDGSAEAMTALAREEADYTVANYSSALPFVSGEEGGDIQFVAALSDEQPAQDSDIGLASDQDVPNWETAGSLVNTVRVLALPPETTDEAVDAWETAIADTLEDSDFVEWAEQEDRPLMPGDRDTATERVMAVLESVRAEEDRLSEIVDL